MSDIVDFTFCGGEHFYIPGNTEIYPEKWPLLGIHFNLVPAFKFQVGPDQYLV